MNKSLGQHNAYVEAGKDKAERNRRLLEAPEEMRAQVKSHVETVFKLKKKARSKNYE